MVHCEHSWLAGDGLKLYGQTATPEAQARGVIALVHGLGEHSGRYDDWMDFFLGRGLAIATMDLRGHGCSGGPRGHAVSIDVLMDDIELLLDQAAALAPDRPLILYGHSLGGLLVINYLIHRRPLLTGAVVTSPGLAPARDPGITLLAGRLLNLVAPTFLLSNGLDRSGLSRNPVVVERYNADPLVHGQISARMGLEVIDTGRRLQAQAGQLPDIPVLLMHGGADRVVDTRAIELFTQGAGPQVTLKTWPDYYHELHNEPERLAVLEYTAAWMEPLLAQPAA